MGGNAIKDIAPLAPLAKLWTLSLGKNQIKDIGVLEKLNRLSTLDLRDNQIEDLAPLAKQTELKLLMIERNQIKDLKPLVDAAKADADGPEAVRPLPAALHRRQSAGGSDEAEAARGPEGRGGPDRGLTPTEPGRPPRGGCPLPRRPVGDDGPG